MTKLNRELGNKTYQSSTLHQPPRLPDWIVASSICVIAIGVGALIGMEEEFAWLALSSFVVIAGLLILRQHPAAAIPIFVLTLPVRGFALFNIGPANIRLSDLILVVITIFLFERWLIHRNRMRLSSLGFALTIWVLFNGLSIMWSAQLDSALFRFVALLRGLAIFYVLSDWLYEDFDHRISLLGRLMAFTAVMVLIGIVIGIQQAGGLSIFEALASSHESLLSSNSAMVNLRAHQIAGIFFQGGPDMWLLTCLSIIVGSASFSSKTHLWQKVGYASLVFAIVLGILVFLRRTTIIGLGAYSAVLFWLVFSGGRKLRTILRPILLSMIILVLGLYLSGYMSVLLGRFSLENLSVEKSVTVREYLYQIAFTDFYSSPIWGVGTGGVLGLRQSVHNLPLQIAAETGIVGLMLFVSVSILSIGCCWRLLRFFKHYNYSPHSFLTMSLLAAIVAYMVQTLASQNFETPDPWILMAVVSAMWLRFGGRKSKCAIR